MKTLTLNINRKHFTAKPQGKEVGTVQFGFNKETVTVQELANEISQGASFKAASLNGTKNADWESQQVFAIDVDNEDESNMLTPAQAYGRCCGLGIRPAFYYESFSSTVAHPKFRLVFITEEVITDVRIRNAVQMALMTIFTESDKSCKDLTRMFFGSANKVTMYNNGVDTINPYTLIQGMVARVKNTETASNASKIVSNYCKSVGLNMINGVPDVKIVTDEKVETLPAALYIYYRGEGEKSKISFNFNIEVEDAYKITVATEGKKNLKKVAIESNKESYSNELVQRFDFDALESRCELWADFTSGARWCYHDEVFGMATNMWRCEGAEKKMVDAIETNDDYNDKYNKVNTIRVCRSYGYGPQRCSDFCPYYSNCQNGGLNMLSVTDNKRGNIRKIEETEFKDRDEIRSELATEFFAIMNNLEDNKLNVIKAPTGIGKTEILKSIEDYSGIVIAAPTHKLAKETFERLNVKGAILASDIELTDKAVEKQYKDLQGIGSYKESYKVLEAYRDGLNANGGTNAAKEVLEINRYLNMQKEVHTTTKLIVCTHQKLMNLNNPKAHTYIIDEDIIPNTAFQNINLSIDELNKIAALATLNDNKEIAAAVTELKSYVEASIANTSSVTTVPPLHFSKKEAEDFIETYSSQLTTNIYTLLKVRKIKTDTKANTTGAIRNELPQGRIIVLSATVNEEVYKGFFSDRELNFIDLGMAAPEGKIIHHDGKGYSRSSLSKNPAQAVERVLEEAPGVQNIITFAAYEKHFEKAGLTPITHFGATTGIDAFGGKDLIVVGTPHITDSTYKLLAAFVAPNAQIISDCEYQNIRRNGYEFFFNTYNANINTPSANVLQEIQLYMIESELIQAVGRARALNNDCTVHIFSNYPLVESVLYSK